MFFFLLCIIFIYKYINSSERKLNKAIKLVKKKYPLCIMTNTYEDIKLNLFLYRYAKLVIKEDNKHIVILKKKKSFPFYTLRDLNLFIHFSPNFSKDYYTELTLLESLKETSFYKELTLFYYQKYLVIKNLTSKIEIGYEIVFNKGMPLYLKVVNYFNLTDIEYNLYLKSHYLEEAYYKKIVKELEELSLVSNIKFLISVPRSYQTFYHILSKSSLKFNNMVLLDKYLSFKSPFLEVINDIKGMSVKSKADENGIFKPFKLSEIKTFLIDNEMLLTFKTKAKTSLNKLLKAYEMKEYLNTSSYYKDNELILKVKHKGDLKWYLKDYLGMKEVIIKDERMLKKALKELIYYLGNL